MKQNRNYISIIMLIGSACFSFYIIAQSFQSKTNQGGIAAALPLAIPGIVLLIPIFIVLITAILREIKYRKVLSNGVKSVGFINKVTETGKHVRKQPEVRLELDVLDEEGNKFLGEATTVVRWGEFELLKEGEPIPIIYNENNKKEITIDNRPDVEKLKKKIEQYKQRS